MSHPHPQNKTAKSDRLMRAASYASVSVAVSLVILKAWAWWVSQSVAMLGSLTDSALDLASSLVTLVAVRVALMPADQHHRFGHGKAEALAGLFQAGVMGATAIILLGNAVTSAISDPRVEALGTVTLVSFIALGLTFSLVVLQAYVIRQTGSLAIAGDHLHYKGDLALNLGVVVAAVLVTEGFLFADGVIGGGIALYILHGSWHVLRPALDMVMDKELPLEDREAILAVASETSGVEGVHNVRSRRAGRDIFVQMHIEVAGSLTVTEGHKIGDTVEARLRARFPNADFLIHIDPKPEPTNQRSRSAIGEDAEEPQS